MTVAVALAMLHQGDRWLLQLRDDMEGILAPGHWGLFGGHLEAGETPEVALRRELEEEIAWRGDQLAPWFDHSNEARVAHFFLGPLTVELHQLHLLEGQDLALASTQELQSGKIWSPKLGEHRPLAPSLQLALERLAALVRPGEGHASGDHF